MYGKIQEAGFIKILPEIHLTKGPVYPKRQSILLFPYSFLSKAQGLLSVNNCSGLIFVDLDGEQNALIALLLFAVLPFWS